VSTQICNHCGQEKPIGEFNWRWKELGIRSPTCRECKKGQQSNYYTRNQEAERESLRQQKADNKALTQKWVNEYKASRGCIDCGESDPVCLDFDHVQGDKRGSVSRLISNNVSLSAIQNEVAKCMVRCANCHRKMTARRGGW
jgi:hypothetical protein